MIAECRYGLVACAAAEHPPDLTQRVVPSPRDAWPRARPPSL